MATKAVIQEIGGEIVAYRHSQLFIPGTKFHRGISRLLQREIIKCEGALHMRSKGLVERWDFLQIVEDKITANNLPDRHMLFLRPFHFTTTISKNIVGGFRNGDPYHAREEERRDVRARLPPLSSRRESNRTLLALPSPCPVQRARRAQVAEIRDEKERKRSPNLHPIHPQQLTS